MYHEELTDEEIRQAAAFVDVADFIESLPGGYDHPVTERGSTLSTGQRQLLALLGPLLRQPKILILDEATANIDQETEEMIQNSLKKMRQGGQPLPLPIAFLPSKMPIASMFSIRKNHRIRQPRSTHCSRRNV